MRATFQSLPEDPTELRAVSELMAVEIKTQAYQIEKLKKELAAHRKARFGSKSDGVRSAGRYRNCGSIRGAKGSPGNGC